MEKKEPRELIIQQLREKASLKQDVFQTTSALFEDLKQTLSEISDDICGELCEIDKRVEIEFRSKGAYEAELKFGGDVLLFHMHTNVFNFDKAHPVWRTSYVRDDESRSYCGMINVYNFLSDSIKYNRINDSGYLVARIFINRDQHFFVEGKRQLGFLYNDFMHSTLDKNKLKEIIYSTILYTIDFDLLTPVYDQVKEISLMEVQEISNNLKIKTGKRLGFKFEADTDSQ